MSKYIDEEGVSHEVAGEEVSTEEKYPWDSKLRGCAFRNASMLEHHESFSEERHGHINCEVEHPKHGWIPITICPEEYPELYARVKDAIQP